MSKQMIRKRLNTGRFLHVLILVVAVLVIFEGKMLVNIIAKHGIQKQLEQQLDELFAGNPKETETETEKNASVKKTTVSAKQEEETEDGTIDTGIDHSIAQVVKEQATPVDDSYFADATFIGDSRLEGFRNQSGITEGTFLTSVGMNVTDIFTKQSIASPEGNITVFQAMYPEKCQKIYFMLGTNELGNVWDDFTKGYRVMLSETKRLFPDATIYAISVPYVEESKVTTGDYINNANVEKMNNIILNICKEGGYYFLDVNEVLSDGNKSLIQDATSDGVHMYGDYCEKMLDYLKTHYVTPSESGEASAEESGETSTEAASEAASESITEQTTEASSTEA